MDEFKAESGDAKFSIDPKLKESLEESLEDPYHTLMQYLVALGMAQKLEDNEGQENLKADILNSLKELGGLKAVEAHLNQVNAPYSRPSQISGLDLSWLPEEFR